MDGTDSFCLDSEFSIEIRTWWVVWRRKMDDGWNVLVCGSVLCERQSKTETAAEGGARERESRNGKEVAGC